MSSIEWTGRTWNPTRGCSRVSAGCDNCYAIRQAHRFSGEGQPYEGLTRLKLGGQAQEIDWTGEVRVVVDQLDVPLRRRKPTTYFVDSMSDLFHESLDDETIAAIFAVMAACPHHTFQILTKRADRMIRWFEWLERRAEKVTDIFRSDGRRWRRGHVLRAGSLRRGVSAGLLGGVCEQWPLANVWLGVSVEDQRTADLRVPVLLRTPAHLRFVSYEPALGPVSFERYMDRAQGRTWSGCRGIDWLIVGGESGPGARACDVAWLRNAVTQARCSEVPVFVKQRGSRWYDSERREGLRGSCVMDIVDDWRWVDQRDQKGACEDEWPQDLRVRQMPFCGKESAP